MLDQGENLEQTTDGTNALSGKVKWFDSSKGFGFVLSDGFESEFFLHKNVLLQFGTETAPKGSNIEFKYENSTNGLKVIEVVSIEKPETLRDKFISNSQLDIADGIVPARVKWFDKIKGYGFVNCFGSAEDVFVDYGSLQPAGYAELLAGQALSIRVAQTEVGKRVYKIHEWPIQ